MVSAAASARAGKGMRASVRSSRLAVLHASRGSVAVTSLGGPLRLSGRDRKSEAAFGCFCSARSAPSFRLACARLPAGRSPGGPFLRSWIRALACPSPGNQGSEPFPSRPSASSHACAPPSTSASDCTCAPSSTRTSAGTCVPPSALASSRTCVPLSAFRFALRLRIVRRFPVDPGSGVLKISAAPGRRFDLATFRGFASPNRSRMRFPEGTCTVSGPCKLLILLWFPAAGLFRLQI